MGHPEARAGIWEGFGWARCELMLGWPHLPAWLAPTNQTFRILKLPRSGSRWRERMALCKLLIDELIEKEKGTHLVD
jgi:hypothetical protein